MYTYGLILQANDANATLNWTRHQETLETFVASCRHVQDREPTCWRDPNFPNQKRKRITLRATRLRRCAALYSYDMAVNVDVVTQRNYLVPRPTWKRKLKKRINKTLKPHVQQRGELNHNLNEKNNVRELFFISILRLNYGPKVPYVWILNFDKFFRAL
jgi:hypothetical protein